VPQKPPHTHRQQAEALITRVARRPAEFETAVVSEPVLEAPAETIIEHNGASQKADAVSSFFADKLADTDTEEIKEYFRDLADPEEFGQRGEGWFFSQLLLVVLIVFPPLFFKTFVNVASVAAIVAGFSFIIAAIRDLGGIPWPFPSLRPKKPAKLVTTGAYHYVRHPMYCGLLLAGFGFSILTGSEARLVLSAALFLVLNRKATVEEDALQRKFSQYKHYQETARKLIPYLY
jgi:protein-S-isoprenylcysteine O-methyltransferase Ste14